MHPPNHQLLDARFFSSLRLTFADERVGRSISSCIIIYIPLSTIARSTVVQYRFCTTHDDALCLVLGSCYLCIWSFSYPPHHTLCHCRSFLRTFINPLTSPLPLAISFHFLSIFFFLQNRVSRWTISASPWALTPSSSICAYTRIIIFHHHLYLLLVRTNKSCCFVDASCCGVDVSFIVRSFFFSASSLTTPCCCCFDAKMYYSIYIPFFCCSHFISAISFFSFTHSSFTVLHHLSSCYMYITHHHLFCFLDRFYFFSQISPRIFLLTYTSHVLGSLTPLPSPKSINAIFLVFPHSSLSLMRDLCICF